MLEEKHCVCEFDFYSAFHFVSWDVLTAFLCRIAECGLLLLLRNFKEFLDGLFGASWPCGEEVVFNCGKQCGCARAPHREMEKGAEFGF